MKFATQIFWINPLLQTLIMSYLPNCYISVADNGYNFDFQAINASVPQGSVLAIHYFFSTYMIFFPSFPHPYTVMLLTVLFMLFYQIPDNP